MFGVVLKICAAVSLRVTLIILYLDISIMFFHILLTDTEDNKVAEDKEGLFP